MRNPITRLASQLVYMDYLGLSLSQSFGYRRVDSLLILRLLRKTPIESLRDSFEAWTRTINKAVRKMSGGYQEHAFNSHKLTPLNYTGTAFSRKLSACIIDHQAHSSLVGGDKSLSRCKLEALLLYPGLMGCQTKMVLGRRCFDPFMLTSEDIVEAKRRVLHEFVFVGLSDDMIVIPIVVTAADRDICHIEVGIQEHWEQSVIKFHEKFGGRMFSDELLVHRASINEAIDRKSQLQQLMAALELQDPWDSALYDYAKLVFFRSN